jgi:hypothetical protein
MSWVAGKASGSRPGKREFRGWTSVRNDTRRSCKQPPFLSRLGLSAALNPSRGWELGRIGPFDSKGNVELPAVGDLAIPGPACEQTLSGVAHIELAADKATAIAV